jgi:hypothetical protein
VTQPSDDIRTWEQLRTSGLLWLVNRVVFHPRGFALALCRKDGQVVGWRLIGDGTEVWRFEGGSEDELFAAAQATLTHDPGDSSQFALPPIPEQSAARVGALNAYTCPAGHITVTIDRDAGVTPAGMPCPYEGLRGSSTAVTRCTHRADSRYRLPPVPAGDDVLAHWRVVTHEWYRPDDNERRTLDASWARHVNQGGLLLRALPGRGGGQ